MGILLLVGCVVIIIVIPTIIELLTDKEIYIHTITYQIKYQNSVKKIKTIQYKTPSKKIKLKVKFKNGAYCLIANNSVILSQSNAEIEINNLTTRKYI